MEIKKNSWSTWLIKLNFGIQNNRAYMTEYYHGEMPKTLCSYFWALVCAILIIPFNIPGLIIGLTKRDIKDPADSYFGAIFWFSFQVLSGVIGMFIFRHPTINITFTDSLLIKGLIAMACGALIIGTILGLIYLTAYTYDNLWVKRMRKEEELRLNNPDEYWAKKEKKPNILMSFIKAKKEKVCPIIEYKD